jgi:hypothetical protein
MSAGHNQPKEATTMNTRTYRKSGGDWTTKPRHAAEAVISAAMAVAAPVAGEEFADAVAAQAGHINFNSIRQCADAWLAVVGALDSHYPGWSDSSGTGMENAVSAIETLATVAGEAAQPMNRAEAMALAREIIRNLGVIDSEIDAAIARMEAGATPAPAAVPVDETKVVPCVQALTDTEAKALEGLLCLAYRAWAVAEDAESYGSTLIVPQSSFGPLCDCLDQLDELPDDQPGYAMEAAAKARWALRRLLTAKPEYVTAPVRKGRPITCGGCAPPVYFNSEVEDGI